VLEGVVRVAPPKAVATPLKAGQEAEVVRASHVLSMSSRPLVQPGAWRSGQLYYDDAPLSEIVADLNRYVPGEIRLANAEIGRERLTTSFRSDQAAQFLESLPDVLPVRLDGKVGDEVVLRPTGK
jgi:transmembrane sensor